MAQMVDACQLEGCDTHGRTIRQITDEDDRLVLCDEHLDKTKILHASLDTREEERFVGALERLYDRHQFYRDNGDLFVLPQ